MNEIFASENKIEQVELIVFKPDNITVGQEVIIKISTSDSDFRLVNAMFDCNISTDALIDTSTFQVQECPNELVVENDTIFIAFEPTTPGRKNFVSPVIGISKGIDGVLRYHSTEFDYTVSE